MSKRPFMDFYRFHRMSLNRHSLLLRRTHRGSVRMPCRLLDWTISRVMVSGRLRRTAEVRGNFYSSLATITECSLTRLHFAWECGEVVILYCVMFQCQNEFSAMHSHAEDDSARRVRWWSPLRSRPPPASSKPTGPKVRRIKIAVQYQTCSAQGSFC